MWVGAMYTVGSLVALAGLVLYAFRKELRDSWQATGKDYEESVRLFQAIMGPLKDEYTIPKTQRVTGIRVFSFCEPSHAGSAGKWCIRQRDAAQDLKLGGGVQTGSLCGRVKAPMGWDLKVNFDRSINDPRQTAHICPQCLSVYRKTVQAADVRTLN